MPIPFAAFIPAISSAISAGGQIGTAAAQGSMNNKTRKWTEFQTYKANEQEQKNYWRDYTTNQSIWQQENDKQLENWWRTNNYNLGLWHTENEYNSPKAQMDRFKSAGLNPHLIYGQNNMGGSVSSGNLDTARAGSPAPSKVHTPDWNPRAPQYDFSQGLMSYLDAEQKQAQTDNLNVQNKVLQEDVALRTLEKVQKGLQNSMTELELKSMTELYQTSVDAVKANLRKTNVETDISLQRNEREALLNASNLREGVERILNMRQQRMTSETENEIRKIDLEWRRMGITPTDNMIFRAGSRLLNSIGKGDYDKYIESWEMKNKGKTNFKLD